MENRPGKRRLRRASLTKMAESVQVPGDYPWKLLYHTARDIAAAGCLRQDDAMLIDQIIRDRDVEAVLTLDDLWGLQCIASFEEHLSVGEIRGRRLLAGLLKKFPFEGSEEQRRSKALNTFLEAEDRCRAFNHDGYKLLTLGSYLPKVVTLARSWIFEVIGERPRWQELVEWARFGPGSTLTTHGGPVSEFFKFSRWPYTTTVDCYKYARFVIETDKRWLGALEDSYRKRYDIPVHLPLNRALFWERVFQVVDSNRISFVPKSARTDRTIAIEPLMNLRLQLGVDGFFRRRLKRHDIDLDDQTKNQVLASLGSELRGTDANLYSTIDLSAASDGVSLKICEMLLPREWYSFLLALRAHNGFVPGHGRVNYEKLSSMGNGYTFAVESLIFAALTQAVVRLTSGTVNFRTDMAIYGDDIIVREKYAETVIHVLQSCGFVVNQDKTFVYGRVKESCGTDWYEGHAVRPVAVDRMPKSVMDLFVDHNRLKRTLSLYFGDTVDYSVCRKILTWVPPNFRVYRGPISDTEFSTYIHTAHHSAGRWSCGRWRYNRLVIRPVEMRVDRPSAFFFRKLMHDLSGRPVSTNPFELRGLGGGSRFAVIFRDNNIMVSETCRPAYSYWQDQYDDVTLGSLFRLSVRHKSQILSLRLDRWLGVL